MFGRGLDNSTPAEKLNIRVASVALGIFTLGIVHAICAAIFLTRQVKAIPQTPSPNIRLQSERFHQSPNKLERKKDETKEDFQIKKICKSKDRKKFPKQKLING
ncbi:MAG: hypothetical protein HWD61_02420 [Parachlamydiaceae bacterium]|nr:MAG: hypothetical protein HWD61_02420 [Parachlamydiaceae bacterium]